jgi:hypothetical protein
MKKIKIIGKRNIEGIKGKKDKKRSIISDNITKDLFDNKKQIEWLNQLYLENNFENIKFAKREVERKLASYKKQDVDKKKLDKQNFIKYNECLEKLVISKLNCYYCKKQCLFMYETVREKRQWTLDRINNDIGHNVDNVVICCLECNLKRGRLNDEKFKFTKQMKIIKKY